MQKFEKNMALERLFKKHNRWVISKMLNSGCTLEEAEDVLQMIFLSLAGNPDLKPEIAYKLFYQHVELTAKSAKKRFFRHYHDRYFFLKNEFVESAESMEVLGTEQNPELDLMRKRDVEFAISVLSDLPPKSREGVERRIMGPESGGHKSRISPDWGRELIARKKLTKKLNFPDFDNLTIMVTDENSSRF